MKWKNCEKEPPEEGIKVLCCRRGDIYVAVKLKDYYVPVPFGTHPFAKELSKPDKWSEIDFPDGLKGKFYLFTKGEMYDVEQQKTLFPKEYNEFCDCFIKSLSNEKSDKELREKYGEKCNK